MKPKPLEVKQLAFCREYLVDFNATAAAIRAGYAKKAARSQAARMLTKANIQAEISRLVLSATKRNDITVDRVLSELGRIAFGDPRKFFDDNNGLKDMAELGDEEAATLSSIEVFEEFEGAGEKKTFIGYTKKVKFWDKVGALDRIARYLKMINTNIDLTSGGEKLNVVPAAIAGASLEQLENILNKKST